MKEAIDTLVRRIAQRVLEMQERQRQLQEEQARNLRKLYVVFDGDNPNEIAEKIAKSLEDSAFLDATYPEFKLGEVVRYVTVAEDLARLNRWIDREVRHIERLKAQFRALHQLNFRQLLRRLQHFLFKNMDDTHVVFDKFLLLNESIISHIKTAYYGPGHSINYKEVRTS